MTQVVKNQLASAGEAGLGRPPGERNVNPLQYFLPGKSPGQRSLAGYSSWGYKESDMTEHAYTAPCYTYQPRIKLL